MNPTTKIQTKKFGTKKNSKFSTFHPIFVRMLLDPMDQMGGRRDRDHDRDFGPKFVQRRIRKNCEQDQENCSKAVQQG